MAGVQQRRVRFHPHRRSGCRVHRSIRDALANECPIRNTSQNRSLAASAARGVGTRRQAGVNSATRLLIYRCIIGPMSGAAKSVTTMWSFCATPAIRHFTRPTPDSHGAGSKVVTTGSRSYRAHAKKRAAVKGFGYRKWALSLAALAVLVLGISWVRSGNRREQRSRDGFGSGPWCIRYCERYCECHGR